MSTKSDECLASFVEFYVFPSFVWGSKTRNLLKGGNILKIFGTLFLSILLIVSPTFVLATEQEEKGLEQVEGKEDVVLVTNESEEHADGKKEKTMDDEEELLNDVSDEIEVVEEEVKVVENDLVGEGHISGSVDVVAEPIAEKEDEYMLHLTINIENKREEPLTDVLVELKLDNSITLLDDSIVTNNQNNVIFSLGTMEALEKLTFTKSFLVNATPGILQKTINAKVTGNIGEESDVLELEGIHITILPREEIVTDPVYVKGQLTGSIVQKDKDQWKANMKVHLSGLVKEQFNTLEVQILLPENMVWDKVRQMNGKPVFHQNNILSIVLENYNEDILLDLEAFFMNGVANLNNNDFILRLITDEQDIEFSVDTYLEIVAISENSEGTEGTENPEEPVELEEVVEEEETMEELPFSPINTNTGNTGSLQNVNQESYSVVALPKTGTWLSSWVYYAVGMLFVAAGSMLFFRFKPVTNIQV